MQNQESYTATSQPQITNKVVEQNDTKSSTKTAAAVDDLSGFGRGATQQAWIGPTKAPSTKKQVTGAGSLT